MPRRSRKQPKYHVGDTVYFATTEMMHTDEPALEMEILTCDYSVQYSSYIYRTLPIPVSQREGFTALQTLGGAAAGDQIILMGSSTHLKHSDEYREWELHTRYEMDRKYYDVRWEVRAKERRLMEQRKAVQAGGKVYAIYSYGLRRRHRARTRKEG